LRADDWLSCFAVALVCRTYSALPSPANPPESYEDNATHQHRDAEHCASGKFGGHDAEKHQKHTKSNDARASLTARPLFGLAIGSVHFRKVLPGPRYLSGRDEG
jgi:hypothetical protein